ncbi:MAG: hypothetical protein IJQ34_08210 [Kiritimatiellae bacterium]|nr:hypothetical protein [Kiritimatiellia bacterium]
MGKTKMLTEKEISAIIAEHNLGISIEDYRGIAKYYFNEDIVAAFSYEKSTDVEERSRIAEALLKHRESRDANIDRMHYSRGMMKDSIHIEMLESDDEVMEISDDGIGIERLIEKIDAELEKLSVQRRKRVDALRKYLVRKGANIAVFTLRLLVANGKDRKKSITAIAKIKGLDYHTAEVKYRYDLNKIEAIVNAKIRTCKKS